MRKYDNATTVENEGEILAGFQYRSLLSYQAYYHIKDIKYGSKNRSTLDFFPLEHVSKTVIFIHGGYWQWCDKSDFAFIAPYILAKGAQCVLLEYELLKVIFHKSLLKLNKRSILSLNKIGK